MRAALAKAYRATGADPPFGDPGRPHGVPFEGYYWRLTDPGSGTVVVALGAVCAGPRGRWGLCTLAVHPGGYVRTRITRAAAAHPDFFGMRAWDEPGELVLDGDASAISIAAGDDCRLDARLHDAHPWPRRVLGRAEGAPPAGSPRRAFGALGPAHAVPFLAQYWHPAVLTAGVRGRLRAGPHDLPLDGATAYAEKNWGRGFPAHWWWGHAAAFGDDVSVAFAGGRIALLGAEVAPTAVVVRIGGRVAALAPPGHRTRVALGDGTWRLRTHGARYAVDIEGEDDPADAFELLVPVPGEERGEPRSRQHLAGRIALRVRRGRRLLYAGESPLAGLERGLPLPPGPPVGAAGLGRGGPLNDAPPAAPPG